MTRTSRLLAILMLCLAAGAAQALDAYYGDHERGWFWHEDPPPPPKKKDEEKKQTPLLSQQASPGLPSLPPDDPRAEIARLREALEIARARAILNPTEENVRDWMEKNHQVLDMGTRFAYAFRRTLLQNPQLDTTLERPVETRAVHAWYDARKTLLVDRLRQIAKKHGLFFFYKGSCPFCHKFAPVLRAFADKYGFQVIAVTLDGGRLPEFPDSRFDPGAELRYGVQRVPMVMLAEPKSRQLKIVTAGFIGPTELERRVYELVEGAPANPATQNLMESRR